MALLLHCKDKEFHPSFDVFPKAIVQNAQVGSKTHFSKTKPDIKF